MTSDYTVILLLCIGFVIGLVGPTLTLVAMRKERAKLVARMVALEKQLREDHLKMEYTINKKNLFRERWIKAENKIIELKGNAK